MPWRLLVVAALAGSPDAPPMPPLPVVEASERSRGLPLPERMAAVTEPLLGARYVLDPAGEGVVPDDDPIARWDAFDCLTFVEEALAQSLGATPREADLVRHALRWGEGPATWEGRRHVMESQWLAGAVEDGWLVETTARYGRTRRLERTLDRAAWRRWAERTGARLPLDALPTGPVAVEILPLDAAREVSQRIRPGSLVVVVRATRADTPLWVTHLGFVLPGSPRRLRHASAMASSQRVRDHDLAWYLTHLATWTRWPVAGIAIFEAVEPPRPHVPPLSSP